MVLRYPTVYLEFIDFKTSVSGEYTVLEEIAAISREGSLFCDEISKATREKATASSLLFDTSYSFALNLPVFCGLSANSNWLSSWLRSVPRWGRCTDLSDQNTSFSTSASSGEDEPLVPLVHRSLAGSLIRSSSPWDLEALETETRPQLRFGITSLLL